jgi:hypothetical protein
MGLQQRLEAGSESLSYELLREQSTAHQTIWAVDLDDDRGPLSAARGIVLGLFLGSILWAAILWVLL